MPAFLLCRPPRLYSPRTPSSGCPLPSPTLLVLSHFSASSRHSKVPRSSGHPDCCLPQAHPGSSQASLTLSVCIRHGQKIDLEVEGAGSAEGSSLVGSRLSIPDSPPSHQALATSFLGGTAPGPHLSRAPSPLPWPPIPPWGPGPQPQMHEPFHEGRALLGVSLLPHVSTLTC